MTAPDQLDLRQQFADAIRRAADDCPPGCDCGDDAPITVTSASGERTIAVNGRPEAFAQVCAAVAQERIDAKDAENARLLDMVQLTIERNVVLRQRAEAAERELAALRDKAARLDELERSIGA